MLLLSIRSAEGVHRGIIDRESFEDALEEVAERFSE
jgi:hypothetical protein